ncbi:MAG: GNAT family N-acetyltransferase, partial [bacterium]
KSEIGFVVLIAVDKHYRRLGIAQKLLNRAIKIQKEVGAKALGVCAWQGSPEGASEKFFAANKFETLQLHKSPWLEESGELGPEGYWCPVCGNPCKCDDLEMMLDLVAKK